MPDLAVPPPTSLYPQPPSQQGALSSNPAQMLDLLGKIQQNYQLQQELKARAAIGNAYQGALTPDGIDPQKLRAGLASDPAASWMLPEAMQHVQGLAAQQFDLAAKKNQFIIDNLGALADKPNLSREDVYNFVVTAARNASIEPAPLVGWLNALPRDPKGLRSALQTARSQAIGSAGLAGRVSAPPTGAGAPAQQSVGQSIFGGAQPVGQPPGEAESQTAAAAGAAELESTGRTTAQYHADLENLRQLNKDIPLAGPTAEWEKKLNQVGSRLGVGITLKPDQLAKAEEFDKIANQVSLNQSRLFHGSDAGLHTVVAANPNLGMSRYGREGVIDMLQGNQDALDRTRQLWLEARRRGTPANSYNQFVNEASKTIDPRVFQFNRMSQANQQRFLSDMDQADLPDFERRYKDAIARGWVKPLKGAKSSQLTTPPMKGARLAPDGEWYVSDAARPGKYQRVVMG